MTTIIKGQPTSAEVRASLAAEGRTVLVAFSGGKDAIATELALQDAGHAELATSVSAMKLMPLLGIEATASARRCAPAAALLKTTAPLAMSPSETATVRMPERRPSSERVAEPAALLIPRPMPAASAAAWLTDCE